MDRNVLFLCTGNSARSQMGEALLRRRAGSVFKAYSAGTHPKEEIFSPVVEVMREVGLDISGGRPKGIEQFLGRMHFQAVIIVCGEAERQCPSIFGSAQRLFWPFDDPAAATGTKDEVLEVCRRVRDAMDQRIGEWLKEQGVTCAAPD